MGNIELSVPELQSLVENRTAQRDSALKLVEKCLAQMEYVASKLQETITKIDEIKRLAAGLESRVANLEYNDQLLRNLVNKL